MNPKRTGEFFIPGQGHRSTEEEHLERYEFAKRLVSGKRVLDIACGVGYGSRMLIEGGASSVVGCDISRDNVEYAVRTYGCDGLKFIEKDARRPIDEGGFDVIVCFETIEHVDNYKAVLLNLYNSLKMGGKLIISSPNRTITSPDLGPEDRAAHYHIREFTIDEFKSHLRTSGFRNIAVYGQRQQRFFLNSFIEKRYKRLFKASKKASAMVEPLKKGLGPEYFVMIAENEVVDSAQ
jgi:SAM-dependent methyltransferase